MKIVITGPNGYIAKNLILSFKSKKNIILLSHKKSSFYKKYKVLKFDLRKGIIPKIECDILIHIAGITPQKRYPPENFKKINFLGIKSIIKKIHIRKKLIFLSTIDVYKNQNNSKPVKESFKIDYSKLTNYAKSKYKSENFLRSLNKKKYPFQKFILRLPGIVGKNNHPNFISDLIERIIYKKKFVYFGKDNYFNNIYHIDTLVKLINSLIKKKIKTNFLIINVGTKKPLKLSKIIKFLRGKMNSKVNYNFKNDLFTINVTRLNKYYKNNLNTKIVIRKYFTEKLKNKK
ncbi:MAG: hypothetical protein CBC25_07040 [Pelagibacteraceae bacterium TMED65]|nr:MAG: hypothetical protein CBC25_07040 [Pelagibacteraceae bacterium TMED65]|tara:strand:- start:290 stop:1156 length:867 start_codon:yes stop_codon:yes gene_type:complete